MPLISIEGNIGAGKTTLLRLLEADPRFLIAYEPVEEWSSPASGDGVKSALELFYSDKARYAFSFQTYALMSRLKLLMHMVQQHPDKIIVCERSHLGDAMIFAQMLHESGMLSDFEWRVYQEWFQLSADLLAGHLKSIVYLRATPDVCAQRIAHRARQGEEGMDFGYLMRLHKKYDDWLCGRAAYEDRMGRPIPVLQLDGNAAEPDLGTLERFIFRNI